MIRWITIPVAILLVLVAAVLVCSSINRRITAEREAKLGAEDYKYHDYDRALAHFTRAVELHPTAKYWTAIATTQYRCLYLTESIQASTQALTYAQREGAGLEQLASLHELRGSAYARNGRCKEALAEYETGIKLKPDTRLYNSLAWLLATASDPAVQDGAQAIHYALDICQQENWANTGHLDTLAAAYARAGQFQEAIRYQQQIYSQEKDWMTLGEYKHRLELYQNNQPYTEDPIK